MDEKVEQELGIEPAMTDGEASDFVFMNVCDVVRLMLELLDSQDWEERQVVALDAQEALDKIIETCEAMSASEKADDDTPPVDFTG